MPVDGFRVHDAPRSVQLDAPLDLFEAMEVSSNVYFAHVALDTGAEAFAEAANRLGIVSPIPFELPGAAGQLNGGDGPIAGFADRVELASAGYGQAEVLVTPLHMALVAAAVGNDGVLVAPRLVDRLRSREGEERTLASRVLSRGMSVETARLLRMAMVRAVEGPFAEAFAGGAAVPGVVTAGKSGTAELGRGRPHSWFVGFAPAEEPRIAIAVVVENAGSGSQRAVPLAGRLMEAYLRRFAD
jgi:peptidoglycan glycosyltransferase